MKRTTLAGLALLAGLWLPACTPGNIAGPPLKPVSTGDAFKGVQCSAIRPKTEPDLMAWDPGERANLNEIRQQGLVVVRYQAKGCDVELQVLSNCDAPGKYKYYPYSSSQSIVANNMNELFGKLPLGAARFASQLRGERALRTDYELVGLDAIPIGTVIHKRDLRGECQGATHVVSKIYLGGFALDAGQKSSIDAAADLFGAGLGGKSKAAIRQLQKEGDPKQCSEASATRQEEPGCSVPLRIALLPIHEPPQASVSRSADGGQGNALDRQVEAALADAANLERVAVGVRTNVAKACAALARDLGGNAAALQGKPPQEVCGVASSLLKRLRARLSSARVTIDVVPPLCTTPFATMTDCASRCDTNAGVEVMCQGGNITGDCGGRCTGRCTTPETNGQCMGTCAGGCSKRMGAPGCTGKVLAPRGTNAECKAICEARVASAVECIAPARVVVKLAGATDAQAATLFRTAIQNDLPAVLAITLGKKAALSRATAGVAAVLEGMASELPAGSAAASRMQDALRRETKASGSISASLRAAVGVQVVGGAG